MYVPESFRVSDQAKIEAFVERYDFAALVSTSDGGIVASHLPVLLKRTPAGPVLQGHLARSNSHWELMNGVDESLAIFQGPHGYVSPTWYARGPAVPTWNYAAVHAYGKPRAVHDLAFTQGLLRELVARYERGPGAWSMENQAPPFLERLVSAIVAFEMPVDRFEAKFKLSQNRSAQDRAGTIAGLERESTSEAAALAAFMQAHLEGE